MIRALALMAYYAVATHLPDLAFPGGRRFNQARCFLLSQILPRFGRDNEIDGNVYIGDGSDVYIGNKCQINPGCRLNRVTIGDFVMIAPDTVTVNALHVTRSTDVPMIEQGREFSRQTVIEDDVWIGTRCVILPGVRIGRGSIVGAGAVVTHDVPPYSVVGGVPARVIKRRGE